MGLLKYFNFSFSKKILDTVLKIPVIRAHGYQNLVNWDNWGMMLYKKLLPELKGAFIDVGMNNGQTLLQIMALDKTIEYIGFEPNPVCYDYVRNLVRINKFINCDLFPAGLNDHNTMLDLYQETEYAPGASVLPKFRNDMSNFKIIQHVALMNGDEILSKKSISKIAMIKVDVEGAELEVIKSLTETIKKYEPVIVLEILPVYTLDSENGKYRKSRQDELLQLFKKINYGIYLINENARHLTELENISVHGDMNLTNYLVVPDKKKELIKRLFL
jgi:FkbM family methyltransferase